MRRLVRFLGTTLLGGLLVVLPIYLAVLGTLALGKKLIGILAPLAKLLPEGVPHPDIVIGLLVVLVCFVAGLVAAGFPRTSVGRGFEEKVLERIPGYSMLRTATRSLFGDAQAALQVALVEMDGLVVGVIVERHPVGWVTVFVPSTPAPASGSVYLVPETKVHPVDVPLGVGLKAASRYGRGAGALLEGLRDRSVLKAG